MHVRRFPASLGSRGGGRGALSSAGLAAHPFRYALIATLGVGCGMAILAAIGALGTVLVYWCRYGGSAGIGARAFHAPNCRQAREGQPP